MLERKFIYSAVAASTLFAATTGIMGVAMPDDNDTPMHLPIINSVSIKENDFDFLPAVTGTVGDRKITGEEVKRQAIRQLKLYQAQNVMIPKNEYRKMAQSIIPQIAQRILVLRLAANDGYKPTPELENTLFTKFEKEYNDDTSRTDDKTCEVLLNDQGLTVGEAKTLMAQDDVIQDWIKNKIVADIQINDEETKSFYEANKDKYFKIPETVTASHILIVPASEKEDDLKNAEVKADEICGDIKSGKADFETEAEKYSQCSSKSNGGSLGQFTRGQMVKDFEDTCFKLAEEGKLGELTTIRTQYGIHIIRVDAYEKGGYREYDEKVSDEIKNNLKQMKALEKIDSMVLDLIAELNPTMSILYVDSINRQQCFE